MATSDLSHYRFRGARALVLLHEKQLRECVEVWKQAKAVNLQLPKTDDTDYQSLEHLLFHVLRAARGYMTWACEKLGLPDPQIPSPPPIERVLAEVEQYLELLLEKWREPLVTVPEERFEETYPSRWKTLFSVESMLEHAVVHPMRHSFQLRELLAAQHR